MREILCRGKRRDNGEWVYWDMFGRITTPNGKIRPIAEEIKHGVRYYHYIYELNIDKKTCGDYTGLTDKNSKRIFDGDIIRWKDENFNIYTSVVEWCGEKFNYPAFDLAKHDYECNGLQYVHEDCIMEVIGNIHDHPELVEVEE